MISMEDIFRANHCLPHLHFELLQACSSNISQQTKISFSCEKTKRIFERFYIDQYILKPNFG